MIVLKLSVYKLFAQDFVDVVYRTDSVRCIMLGTYGISVFLREHRAANNNLTVMPW